MDSDKESNREPRQRTMTGKGQEQFEMFYNKHFEKYEHWNVKLHKLIPKLVEIPSSDKHLLQTFHNDLSVIYENYEETYKTLSEFLMRNKTVQSVPLLEDINKDATEMRTKVNQCLDKVRDLIQQTVIADTQAEVKDLKETETASHPRSSVSTGSHQSSSAGSSLRSAQAQKRAKAEAARAKLAFSKKEKELREKQALLIEQNQLNIAKAEKEKSFIEAELKFLDDEKEATAAITEAEMLEDAVRNIENMSLTQHSIQNLGSVNSKDRVNQYVCAQNKLIPDLSTYKTFPEFDKKEKPVFNQPSPFTDVEQPSVKTPHPSTTKAKKVKQDVTLNLSSDSDDSECRVDQQQSNPSVPVQHPRENSTVAELGQFLLKKELSISRLTQFNEKPETYESWKVSFKRLVMELKMSAIDELDMLIKWLGPISKKYAESTKNSNMNDPARGVKLLWERLDRCYGTPEEIEASLLQRLNEFKPITWDDPKRYYDLVDLLSEIESLQHNKRYRSQLAVFNTSSGVTPIARRLLPHAIYEKWMTRATHYKTEHHVTFPPFSVFVTFIKDTCVMRNDPSFMHEPSKNAVNRNSAKQKQNISRPKLNVKKTAIVNTDQKSFDVCPIHLTNHSLNECRTFRAKPIFVRRKFLRENNICFGCCESKDHFRQNCSIKTECSECRSKDHPTALHIYIKPKDGEEKLEHPYTKPRGHGGEENQKKSVMTFDSKCTEVCGKYFPGKSCAKIVLVRVYHKDHPKNSVLTYAILDEQSNQSLARTELFSLLHIDSPEIEYSVTTCAGSSGSAGKIAENCVVESYDGVEKLNLPPLIECDNIPVNRDEIPTPEVAVSFEHLKDIGPYIPPLHDVKTLLLIGRDLNAAHHILDQRLSDKFVNYPFAQKLRLGWVIVGESCLDKVHKPNIIVQKTHLRVLPNGRPTMFPFCENDIKIHVNKGELGANVFKKRTDDNKVGMSIEDKEFLHIMDRSFSKTESGNWQALLPFRPDRTILPNNRAYTLRRALNLHNCLMKNIEKRQHMISFVGNMLDLGHAEVAPPLQQNEESWYLPLFGIYNPHKPGKIRVVFDSSACYQGVSLNSVLLHGPDLNNSLLDVLLRFRTDAVAIMTDIEQMFHSFVVKEEHRNFLRFFWYQNNDPDKQIIEYRMTVHLLGNSPSPAVACYFLKKTAYNSESKYGSDVKSFICEHFYVDDGLISLPSAEEIINLVTRTKKALKEEGNLHLHKFASNSIEVMKAFSSEELAKDLKDLNFNNDYLPTQQSLGITWKLQSDNFGFRVAETNKPFTRRGILSAINSLYDPLGFAAPVIIAGKLFLRKVMQEKVNWDDPIPPELESQWTAWTDSLHHLQKINIPRCYTDGSFSFFGSTKKDLILFCDASEDAIAAVAYIQSTSASNEITTRFVMGKAKVAPSHGHSMPRLELCAAVLSVELHDTIISALKTQFDNVWFHTDSKVVLGYINNRTRRFFMYVSNRVERIHQSSHPHQWIYVASKFNPADCATRAIAASDLEFSPWLLGPSTRTIASSGEDYPLVDPDTDKELKVEVSVKTTSVSVDTDRLSDSFMEFDTWILLLRAVSYFIHVLRSFKHPTEKCHGWHQCDILELPENIQSAKLAVLQIVQRDYFCEEIKSLKHGNVSRNSPLYQLDPFMGEDGLIRVGGRLRHSKISKLEKFPILLPKDQHVSRLLVLHYHHEVHHQGRQITEGALRSAGYWIIGEKKLISKMIHHCLTCRKLRAKPLEQKMADLPDDRLTPAPPFTYVGLDVFGPWKIAYRRTRGGTVHPKRWAVLFTCLTIRAIHIEVIEEMTSSCFINALRRFISIRGPVKELRSDCGSNFIGSVDDLEANVINVEDPRTSSYLSSQGITWKFNPPHSSHMGGVWERMIGDSRRILDSLLSDTPGNSLTHEVLVTFMCEVMAIVNARPLVPVSSDPSNPFVLSPSVLITQKTNTDVQPFKNIDQTDMYKHQWKRVQILAENFWKRWSKEYIQTLQKRTKWEKDIRNLEDGDVVLMKDNNFPRNNWPLGVIVNAIKSDDDRVRKAKVRVIRDGTPKEFIRPISELIYLFSNSD